MPDPEAAEGTVELVGPARPLMEDPVPEATRPRKRGKKPKAAPAPPSPGAFNRLRQSFWPERTVYGSMPRAAEGLLESGDLGGTPGTSDLSDALFLIWDTVFSATFCDILMLANHWVRAGPLLTSALVWGGIRGFRKIVGGIRHAFSWPQPGEEPPNDPSSPGPTPGDFWNRATPPTMTRGPHYIDIIPPACPKCGGGMTLREGRVNRQLFWGCLRFRVGKHPCDGTRDTTIHIVVRYC